MNTLQFGTERWNPRSRVLLADGAWGTQLIERGLSHGDVPEAWNLDRPQDITAVAEAYVGAGSDIVLTNSFGASRTHLERHGLGDQTYAINKAAAELTKRAVSARRGNFPAVVAGDIGPCGKLVVMGEIEEQELFDVFIEQATALRDGGAQWLVIETMIDAAEMAIAVRAAATLDLPVVASMTYEKGAHGYRTVMGNTVQECLDRALSAGAAVVGANCGAGIDTYIELAAILRGLTSAPLWIKANAGLPEIVDGKTVYRMNPQTFCSHVGPLLDSGVNIIGGCCGTDPRFVAGMRAILDARSARKAATNAAS